MSDNPLRSYWHPVALGAELTTKPLAVTLLDEPPLEAYLTNGVAKAEPEDE